MIERIDAPEGVIGLRSSAWLEDMKAGLSAWVQHHSAWRRFALVTDVEWVAG